jgi:predicted O-methyltransferase YrrM
MGRAAHIAGRIRAKSSGTRFEVLGAVPERVRLVTSYDWAVIRESIRWLRGSREYTNFTYDLTDLNRLYLAWFVAGLTGAAVAEVRALFSEIERDERLIECLRLSARTHRLADPVPRFGRRLAWYALARILKPAHIVESGTDKGLGSLVFASALLRNGSGRLTTIDPDPRAGYLITGQWAEVTDLIRGDSIVCLRDSSVVDLFLHDSLHTAEHEAAELSAVESQLAPRAVVMSDNAHATSCLAHWSERRGWNFAYFQERPKEHWYPGGGLGVAYHHVSDGQGYSVGAGSSVPD